MEIEIHGYEKCKIDLQQKEPNLHLLNIILGQSEVHATKTFVLQPAIMLMNHHKRQIFPLPETFQLGSKISRLLINHNLIDR